MFIKEGDTVLDPFAGYGSIPIVCELFNRKWIGFEMYGKKYRKAVDFIKHRRIERISCK
ncbi:MAG: DNA methyltransferase [Candidatus Bathyarchaeia archaeon]